MHMNQKPVHQENSSDVPGINFTIFDRQASCNVAHVSYKVNLREPRGPRRIFCSLKCHSSSDGGGAFPIPEKGTIHLKPKEKQPQLRLGSSSSTSGSTVLRNKAPLWKEDMEYFTLNFRGRAAMSSAKNFQLIAPSDTMGSTGNRQGNEKMLLQFRKVREDTFTVGCEEPLSAFKAVAICLSSFGWKFPWQWSILRA